MSEYGSGNGDCPPPQDLDRKVQQSLDPWDVKADELRLEVAQFREKMDRMHEVAALEAVIRAGEASDSAERATLSSFSAQDDTDAPFSARDDTEPDPLRGTSPPTSTRLQTFWHWVSERVVHRASWSDPYRSEQI